MITALVAIESLGCDADRVLAECVAKILARIDTSQAGSEQSVNPIPVPDATMKITRTE